MPVLEQQTIPSERQSIIEKLPDGEAVTNQPQPILEPLPILEGSLPEDWKDAIYDENQ